MVVERWEVLCYGRKGLIFGAWNWWFQAAKSVQAVMEKWPGGRPHGTNLMLPEALLGLLGVSCRYAISFLSHCLSINITLFWKMIHAIDWMINFNIIIIIIKCSDSTFGVITISVFH